MIKVMGVRRRLILKAAACQLSVVSCLSQENFPNRRKPYTTRDGKLTTGN
jgi:hypothetical protein